MNNKEKLYLVKLAEAGGGVLGAGLGNMSVGDFFKHPAGSVGAAFSGPPAGGAAAQPKSLGFLDYPKSQHYKSLTQEQRQKFDDATEWKADSPLIQQLTRQYKHRPSVISNGSSSKLNPATYADLPTAKGGLQNIPPRPPSHPLSKQTQGIADPKAVDNTMNRMDRGMPVQLHKPYGK